MGIHRACQCLSGMGMGMEFCPIELMGMGRARVCGSQVGYGIALLMPDPLLSLTQMTKQKKIEEGVWEEKKGRKGKQRFKPILAFIMGQPNDLAR